MTRPAPGWLPALVAAAATLLACALMVAVSSWGAGAEATAGLAALVLLPLPLLVSVLWGAAVVMSRPHRAVLVAAALWLAVAWFAFPGATTWPVASHVAVGLVAGVALGARWRLDVALGGIALALVPLTVWSVVELPVGEQLDMMRQELRPALERALPADAAPEQRAAALAREEENLARFFALIERIYPYLLGTGLLGQGLLLLFLVWLALRLLGWRLPGWRPPPFGRWRLPFYLVWLLILGLGLTVTRLPLAGHVGVNVALLAATVLSVQGIAVQFHFTARIMSPLGRVVFWTVAGLFLTPMVMALGVVLGVADQWLDLRGLSRPPAAAG